MSVVLPPKPSRFRPVLISACVFLTCALMIMAAILFINDGHFSFSLDDPYIHLALAKHLLNGHYGINTVEFSAPSSSILWPFLIAPLTALPIADLLVLALNLLLAVLTLMGFHGIIRLVGNNRPQGAFTERQQVLLLTGFMLFANSLGLAFIGMEHQLQVLLACLTFYGLLLHVNQQRVTALLWCCILLNPLVRYESLSISVAALLYLSMNDSKIHALIALLATMGLLALFSLFLLQQGGSYLPDSVLVKSDTAASGISKIYSTVTTNLHYPKGIALLGCALLFLYTATRRQLNSPERSLYLCLALAIGAHLLLGRIGWYFRYELSIWVLAGCGLFYRGFVTLSVLNRPWHKRVNSAMVALVLLVGMLEHLVALVTTPLAASNVHHQQGQMARFVRDFYQQPVAVNDLGRVAFDSSVYVLDLWGLGSSQARQLRTQKNPAWMQTLAAKNGVKLAMIYHNKTWFPDVPDQWVKVGQLTIDGPIIVSWFPVSFYATEPAAVAAINHALTPFIETLPAHSHFTFQTTQ